MQHLRADDGQGRDDPPRRLLRTLDGYLRDLWLECCGRLSLFEIDRRTFALQADLLGTGPFDDPEDESMDVAVATVLGPGEEARHLYDMGSTTELRVRCLQQRAGDGDGDGEIRLLARNAQPRFDCLACGALATTICTECSWDGPPGTLCDDCVPKHPCDDELYLPIVNSPRFGVCGYTG